MVDCVMLLFAIQILKEISNKKKILKKKPKQNRNGVKPTGFGSVRFFRAKTGSNRFGSVFPVLARFFFRFFGLARFFFRFFVGFGFFGFLLIKPKPNRPVFSKI